MRTPVNPTEEEAPKTSTFLSNSVYDKLKWITSIVLPAAATFYAAVAAVWGFPFAEEITTTLTALILFLGTVLQISSTKYKNSDAAYDGQLVVNTSDPEKDTYSLIVDTPLSDIPGKSSLVLKTVNSQDLQ